MWQDSLQSVEVRKLTEMNALELQAARAENEANTLRMNNQRILFIAIVCGLLLIGAFLVIYLLSCPEHAQRFTLAFAFTFPAYLLFETTALVLIGLEAFNHALRHMNRRENPSKNGENSSSDADFSSNEE